MKDFEVRIPTTGKVILTSSSEKAAISFARHAVRNFPNVVVEKVIRYERRIAVWTANPKEEASNVSLHGREGVMA